MSDANEDAASASVYVWIGLCVITGISFWTQATVTEERLVPALNVIATHFNIPYDVSGATLMAAGASSPELFSSFTSLFITKSSMGLGTIVGSEIFNQLSITAGAILSCKDSKRMGLRLDRAIVTREVFFYALSIVLLYAALQDTRPDPDDGSGEDHIYISFWQACYVFCGYIGYVLVCAKMDSIVAFFSKIRIRRNLQDNGGGSGIFSTPSRTKLVPLKRASSKLPFLREKSLMDREPSCNFETVAYYRSRTGEVLPDDTEVMASEARETMRANLQPQQTSSDRTTTPTSKHTMETEQDEMGKKYSNGALEFLMHKKKPSDEHGLYDLEVNTREKTLSCFLWQRSYFYNRARQSTHGWHLRWFTFTENSVYSVPDRRRAERHGMTYPCFHQVEVDEHRLIFRIVNPRHSKNDLPANQQGVAGRHHHHHHSGRSYYLMAPNQEILDAVILKMGEIMEANDAALPSLTTTTSTTSSSESPATEVSTIMGDLAISLLEFPAGASVVTIFFFVVLFPFRLLMHISVPDVRIQDRLGNPVGTISTAFGAVVACLVWLVVSSYAMVTSLETLASLLDVPNALIGVTVSAAGTSLPNYVASRVAAEQGFGNMAVSNAFGSNTFNIMIGLGLPWLIYTSIGTGFQPYHGLRNEGILESVFVLGTVLLVFVAVILPSGFVLYRWHAFLFIVMYVAYLAYEIGRVYF